ncbi:MAG: hypothetical protein V1837_03715 [Candidatus Woesearchaeota archaeon]
MVALTGIKGEYANTELLLYAITNKPSLIIDCANCADPHSLFPFVFPEDFVDVHVIEIELLYLLRDVLKRTGALADELKLRCVVIPTFDYLFAYDDKEENNEIFSQCWKLIKDLSLDHNVVVAIHKSHDGFAAGYCDKIVEGEFMGHTVRSQRCNLDVLLEELNAYGKSLNAKDKEIFEKMLKLPYLHVGSISYANSFHAWAFLLLSIMLEQEKRIKELEEMKDFANEIS